MGLVHVILMALSAAENRMFLLVKVTVCCRLYNRSQAKVVQTKTTVQQIQ